MITAMALLRALAVAAIALVLLREADKGMWWHACQFRAIRRRADNDELYRRGVGARRFFVPTKIIPAALICIGVAWMTAVDQALAALFMAILGIIAFVAASGLDAYRTLYRLDGR
jgi:hypothetical protein